MNTETHYKTETLDLRLMDCMDLMKEYPDKHFDLAIVDPPYGIGWDKQNLSASLGLRKDGSRRVDKSWKARNTAKEKYKRGEWDSKIPETKYFEEIFRVSKKQIIWGGNYFPLPPTGGWIIWDKKKPHDVSFSEGEMAWTNCCQSVRFFRWLWAGYAKEEPENRIHPTQKPVALYRWLLANYAKDGMKILDTHLGSMSHAIAAHYGGVHLTGCELDPDYFADGIERVKNETSQLTLF
jgi:site-specific DNA-methyltransferase (adenine-specific)